MSLDMLVTDWNGVRQGELVGASLDNPYWTLNEAGGCSISINPLRKAAELIKVNECEIQIWIDGEYRHCVVPRDCQGDSKKISFPCEGIMSYLAYRFIHDSLQYGTPPDTGMEQFQIVQNLVNYAQVGANKDRRIVMAPWSSSGRARFKRWEWYEHKEILSEIADFADVDGGFDFDIALFGDGRREFTVYYPMKGVRRDNEKLEWGRNVVDYKYNQAGKDQGTHVWATGGSSGDVRFEAHHEHVAYSQKYGVIEKVVSAGGELDVGWLSDRAIEEVASYGNPVTIPDLVVKDDPVKLDGVLDTGDIVPVDVNHGRCKMVGDYRIVKIQRLRAGRLQLSFNEYREAA